MEVDIVDMRAKYVSFEEGFDFVIEDDTEDLTRLTNVRVIFGNSCTYNRPQGHQYMFENWCTRKV